MLPVAVKQHQETLGKVQDLTWNIQDLLINVPSAEYPFANPDFLKTYTQKVRSVSLGHPAMNLRGKDAPQFMLKSFDGRVVSSSDFEGKVVLLDFWEVWCGPCVESMPKIQNLYEKFKSKGLLVYGIINDIKQLESSRKFVLRKPDIKFPMLVGNEDIKKSYFIDAVPQYVLIDRKGKISFLSLGYSGEIESEVTKALNQQ
jgi:peroxiredoxin